ncbi:hypothetical protein KY285_002217 [Solanum tuberosum]|nr:hypothetical protein KY285_002217 [Solanum tuberosum]
MDIYICHKGKVFIKPAHVINESFETTCNEADKPNKESTNKVGECLNAPLGKEITLIDGRDQIVGVQQSNLIENDSRNTNEAEDEFKFSSEDEDSEKDEVETIVHSDVESDENVDFSSDEDGYESDIHEELSLVKKDLKAYLKEKKSAKEKKIAECFLGEVGIDPGFEDIDKPKKNLTDKLVGDEPFYDSSDADSFESESEGEIDVERSDILKVRKKDKRVSYDPTWKKVVWQLNMVFENVKKFRKALSKYAIERGCQLDKIHNNQRRVRVKCKANGCLWILYASKDFKSFDFIIKTYNPRLKCYRTNTNTMCDSKFLAKYYKSRIVSQPCIKG